MLQARHKQAGARSSGARTVVLGAVLLVVLMRLPMLGVLAYPDEAGVLLVAREWHGGGPELYGDLWLDRPPLLVLLWWLADHAGGVLAARLIGLAAAVALTLLAAWVGGLVGDRRGTTWAALITAALTSTPLLGQWEANAELFGGPFLLLSAGAAIKALSSPAAGPAARWAFLSGLSGVCAVLVKQNLVDGVVFALALGVLSWRSRASAPRRLAAVLTAWLAGAAAPVMATVLWVSLAGPGVSTLVSTLFGFRVEAAEVVAAEDTGAPLVRFALLLGVAVATGIAIIVAVYLWHARSQIARARPLVSATTAMLLVGLVGVVAGASYWSHYLIVLIPVVALMTGQLAGDEAFEPGRPRLPVLVVLTAVIAMVGAVTPLRDWRVGEERVVAWLQQASRPSDTALVTYGHSDLIEAPGLRPADYPYLWSLPIRTLDPELTGMVATLRSERRPTWLIEWHSFNSWGLDDRGILEEVVEEEYRPAEVLCGVEVYLREDVQRDLPAAPPC
jgi:hypothetical protein